MIERNVLPTCSRIIAIAIAVCLLGSASATADSDAKKQISPELKTSIEKALNDVGTRILEKSIGPDDVVPLLRQFLVDHPKVYGSAMAYAPKKTADGSKGSCPYVYRHDGKLAEKNLATKDYDYTHWDWYTKPRDSRSAVWSEPYFDKGGGEAWMTTYSLPLFRSGTDGELVGIVTADVLVH